MPEFKTPLDAYKLLPKTNCRQCGLATCMAFATEVFKVRRPLGDCPFVERSVAMQYATGIKAPPSIELAQEQVLNALRATASRTDMLSRASLLGARVEGNSLVVKCLGRDFTIDEHGAIASQCHTHAWFSVPLMNYVLFSQGLDPTGQWVPLRELPSGPAWEPLYKRRSEEPIKQIADNHPDLFEQLVDLFDGREVINSGIASDISVALYPFPKVPILVSYWRPEDDMSSQLHIFFDRTAEGNLNMDSIYALCGGLANMFEKIMLKHR